MSYFYTFLRASERATFGCAFQSSHDTKLLHSHSRNQALCSFVSLVRLGARSIFCFEMKEKKSILNCVFPKPTEESIVIFI